MGLVGLVRGMEGLGCERGRTCSVGFAGLLLVACWMACWLATTVIWTGAYTSGLGGMAIDGRAGRAGPSGLVFAFLFLLSRVWKVNLAGTGVLCVFRGVVLVFWCSGWPCSNASRSGCRIGWEGWLGEWALPSRGAWDRTMPSLGQYTSKLPARLGFELGSVVNDCVMAGVDLLRRESAAGVYCGAPTDSPEAIPASPRRSSVPAFSSPRQSSDSPCLCVCDGHLPAQRTFPHAISQRASGPVRGQRAVHGLRHGPQPTTHGSGKSWRAYPLKSCCERHRCVQPLAMLHLRHLRHLQTSTSIARSRRCVAH